MMNRKRIFAWMLTLMMLFQIAPLNAFAEGGWTGIYSQNDIKGATYYEVRFHTDGAMVQLIQSGTTLQTLPEDPFKEGHTFEGWYVDEAHTDKVELGRVISGDLDAYAWFKPISVYQVTVTYWYEKAVGGQHVFDTQTFQFDTNNVPYTITPPATVLQDSEQTGDTQNPIYYPLQSSLVIESTDLPSSPQPGINELAPRDVQYVPFTATYDYVYYLKNLTGDDYNLIETVSAQGVMGSTVSAPVKNYPYAEFDHLVPTYIGASSGVQVPAYYTRKVYTLTFDSTGGSYVVPIDAPYQSVVSIPSVTPTRTGYIFMGWFDSKGADGNGTGNQITSSLQLNADQTVYAKWQGQTVGYTIIYLKEKYKAGGNEWVYENSSPATGTVGDTVFASGAPDLAYNMDGYEKDATLNATSSVVIAADGSSVLFVYYKLIRYTLEFLPNGGTVKMGGSTYTGTNYYTVYNVVVGQDVASVWPSSSTEIYRANRYFRGWNDGYHNWNQITRVQLITYEYFKGANTNRKVTWTAQWSNTGVSRNAEYWLQQPDGSYVEEVTYRQIGVNATNLSPKDIAGYAQHNGNASAPTGYQGSGGDPYTYRFYYDRYSYTISYYDGGTKLKETDPILFEANINNTTYN